MKTGRLLSLRRIVCQTVEVLVIFIVTASMLAFIGIATAYTYGQLGMVIAAAMYFALCLVISAGLRSVAEYVIGRYCGDGVWLSLRLCPLPIVRSFRRFSRR